SKMWCQLKITVWLCVILTIIQDRQLPVEAVVRDLCQVVPSAEGLCLPSTLGIHYDPETQRCRYVGCSTKKLFSTIEDCDKICNNPRHWKRRNRAKANETTL
ncbi:hypothetical protein KR009_001819, partial [Drosophila setifemur]